ncbi:MAG: hypothetical protein IH840_16480 [Candidatus Heimdallarchaeota archaeon]|nr:hypothetical protein [Candidatus Heimdallarchaeota archaeon]
MFALLKKVTFSALYGDIITSSEIKSFPCPLAEIEAKSRNNNRDSLSLNTPQVD